MATQTKKTNTSRSSGGKAATRSTSTRSGGSSSRSGSTSARSGSSTRSSGTSGSAKSRTAAKSSTPRVSGARKSSGAKAGTKKGAARGAQSSNSALLRDILILGAIVLVLFLFLSLWGLLGKVGQWIGGVEFGLFGSLAYLFPFLTLLLIVYLMSNVPYDARRGWLRALAIFLTFTVVCGLATLLSAPVKAGIGTELTLKDWYVKGNSTFHGGFFGGLWIKLLLPALGKVGSGIALIALLIAGVVLSAGKALLQPLGRRGREMAEDIREQRRVRREEAEARRMEKNLAEEERRLEEAKTRAEERRQREALEAARRKEEEARQKQLEKGRVRLDEVRLQREALEAEEARRAEEEAKAQQEERDKAMRILQLTDGTKVAGSEPPAPFTPGNVPAADPSADTAEDTAAVHGAVESWQSAHNPVDALLKDMEQDRGKARRETRTLSELDTMEEGSLRPDGAPAPSERSGRTRTGRPDLPSFLAGVLDKPGSMAAPSGVTGAAQAEEPEEITLVSGPSTRTIQGTDVLYAQNAEEAFEQFPGEETSFKDPRGEMLSTEDADLRWAKNAPPQEETPEDIFPEDVSPEEQYADELDAAFAAQRAKDNAAKAAGTKRSGERAGAAARNAETDTAPAQTEPSAPDDKVLTFKPSGAAAARRTGESIFATKERSGSSGSTFSTLGRDARSDRSSLKGNTGARSGGPQASAQTAAAQGSMVQGSLPLSTPEPKEYRLPPTSLLTMGSSSAGMNERNLKETADILEQTLRNFGVEVTVTDISCGPSVTRFELRPEQGVKVARITGLADDIKLALAVTDVRIEAPIPGKSAVGIEVPNAENQTVHLRTLIESEEFRRMPSRLAFAVGMDIGGKTIVHDLAKMPHVLIAGATGSGKSVCINTLIMSILYKAKPDEVQFIMIDPKVVELGVYNGIPHLRIPVVTDPKLASEALNGAVKEMTARYKRFADLNVRDIKGYNQKIRENPEEYPDLKIMPQIVVIVDEFADLMMVAASDVEQSVCRLAQLARAAGIHLVLATQRPSVNVITGLIKANVQSRIAFAVSSGIDSRTILDMNGAEKLLGKGDMLFYPTGYVKPVRMQGGFVSDEEVAAVTDFWKAQNTITPKEAAAKAHEWIGVGETDPANADEDPRDPLFIKAAEYIIDSEKASIGNLQRVFRIGFNRAARLMDQLADDGIVGKEDGTKARQILMDRAQLEDWKSENGLG